jgi:hypothetical protein
MSVTAAQAVRRFDWARVAQDIVAVYETVMVEPARVSEDTRSGRLARLVGLGGS